MTRKQKVGAIVTGILILLALLARPVWEGICGNSSIAFYGQVIDADGKGMQGVRVTFAVLYSPRPMIPVPFGVTENVRYETVTTDGHGNFGISGIYGYSIRTFSAKHGGKNWGFVSTNRIPTDDPGFGVSMNSRTSLSKLPDAPGKRVVYKLVELPP